MRDKHEKSSIRSQDRHNGRNPGEYAVSRAREQLKYTPIYPQVTYTSTMTISPPPPPRIFLAGDAGLRRSITRHLSGTVKRYTERTFCQCHVKFGQRVSSRPLAAHTPDSPRPHLVTFQGRAQDGTRRAVAPGSGPEQACNQDLNWTPGSGPRYKAFSGPESRVSLVSTSCLACLSGFQPFVSGAPHLNQPCNEDLNQESSSGPGYTPVPDPSQAPLPVVASANSMELLALLPGEVV